MNRSEYRKARSLIRANGWHATRWMPANHVESLEAIRDVQCRIDLLSWRAVWSRKDTPMVRLLLTTPFQSVLSRFS